MASTQHSDAAATTEAHGPAHFARLVLKLDAAVTGLNGIAYLALTGWLASLLGVDTGILYPVGAVLLVYAIGVLAVATRKTLNRNAVSAIAVTNLLWSVLSIVVVVSGALSPTGAGAVWIVLQALVVALFAGAQYVALKRM